MKKQKLLRTSIASTLGAVSMQAQAVNQFENLSSSGTPVALVCQGVQEPTAESATTDFCRLVGGSLPTLNSCRFASAFPGIGGKWMRVRNVVNQALVANGTTVGVVDDRVWQRCDGNVAQDDYIFGLQVKMNSNDWTEPNDDNMGLSGTNGCDGGTAGAFEVNDIFRSGFNAVTTVQTAYRIADPAAEEGSWRSGRTQEGLAALLVGGGTALTDPARDNDWVNWRTDASPEDPDGISPGNSAYMFVRMSLGSADSNSEVSTSQVSNAIRIEEGGEEGQCKYRIQANGFKPL